MMEKRMLKKVSTVTAAGIMMTAMLGMQVSAAESSDSETEVKKTPMITKQITKESNIYAPKIHLNLPLLQERQCRQVRIRRQYMQDRQRG